MAILFPLIILMIFAAVQVATYYTARSVALTAAQAAVAAERQLGAEPGEGRLRAQRFLSQHAGDWLGDPSTGGGRVGDPLYSDTGVSYTVRGQAISIIPWVTWEVSQTAHGTLERFTVNPGGAS